MNEAIARPQARERATARSNTASSIGSVSRPVNVFCWLGWYEHSTVGPPGTRPRGRGRTSAAAVGRNARRPRRTRSRRGTRSPLGGACPARGRGTARTSSRSAGVGALSGGAHFTGAVIHASRSSKPSSTSTDVGWLARPARNIARISQSPLRSPVKTRPVRLPPCAAGANPTTAMRADGVAEAGYRASPVLLVAVRRPLLPRHAAPASSRAEDRCGTRSPRRVAGAACRADPRRPTLGWRPHDREDAHPIRRRPSSWSATARRRRPARSCPAGRAGCTSPMSGESRPSGPLTGSPQVPNVDAVYTSPLERARETAAPIGRAAGRKPQIDRGLLECDFGEWTGASLRRLMRKQRVVDRAACTVVVPLPRRRELHRDADADRDRARAPARRAPRRDDRLRLACRSDQGRRRPRPWHAPRPVPAHRHQPVLDQHDRLVGRRPRGARRELDRPTPDRVRGHRTT